MPNIQPFQGLRYNLAQVGSLSDVVAPPYDVISPEQQDVLYARHPNNVVRLILNKQNPTDDEQNNRYTRSARALKEWKESGVLVKEPNPSIYVYHQIFEAQGKKFVRKGFMCGCEAVPFGEGMVSARVDDERSEARPPYAHDRVQDEIQPDIRTLSRS